jgi:hypothetical protein
LVAFGLSAGILAAGPVQTTVLLSGVVREKRKGSLGGSQLSVETFEVAHELGARGGS